MRTYDDPRFGRLEVRVCDTEGALPPGPARLLVRARERPARVVELLVPEDRARIDARLQLP